MMETMQMEVENAEPENKRTKEKAKDKPVSREPIRLPVRQTRMEEGACLDATLGRARDGVVLLGIVGTGMEMVNGHYEYFFQISHPMGCSWRIQHRFNDFLALHQELKKKQSGVPAFPAKHSAKDVLFTKEREMAAKRITELQKYLQQVVGNPELASLLAVQKVMGVTCPDSPSLVTVTSWEHNRFDSKVRMELAVELEGGAAQVAGCSTPIEAIEVQVNVIPQPGQTPPEPLSATYSTVFGQPVRIPDLPSGMDVELRVSLRNSLGSSAAVVMSCAVPLIDAKSPHMPSCRSPGGRRGSGEASSSSERSAAPAASSGNDSQSSEPRPDAAAPTGPEPPAVVKKGWLGGETKAEPKAAPEMELSDIMPGSMSGSGSRPHYDDSDEETAPATKSSLFDGDTPQFSKPLPTFDVEFKKDVEEKKSGGYPGIFGKPRTPSGVSDVSPTLDQRKRGSSASTSMFEADDDEPAFEAKKLPQKSSSSGNMFGDEDDTPELPTGRAKKSSVSSSGNMFGDDSNSVELPDSKAKPRKSSGSSGKVFDDEEDAPFELPKTKQKAGPSIFEQEVSSK